MVVIIFLSEVFLNLDNARACVTPIWTDNTSFKVPLLESQ